MSKEAKRECITEKKERTSRKESLTLTKIISKKKLLIATILLMLIGIIGATIFTYKKSNVNQIADPELLKTMTYGIFEDNDYNTSSEYVKFGAFFLRDIDNDGQEEKIKGTCKEIGKEDTLYIELDVLEDGEFKNGVITINADNFYFQTSIPKDNEIKENAIGNNVSEIKLNTINVGTQKKLTGVIKAGDYSSYNNFYSVIGTDITKFSKVNSVTLTGTHIAFDGTRTEINKTIEFNIDWYSKVTAEIPEYIQEDENNLSQVNDIAQAIDEKNGKVDIEFSIGTQETENKTCLEKVSVVADIPLINGYEPLEVTVKNNNVEYTYDNTTRKLYITKEMQIGERGTITSNCYDGTYNANRYNKFDINVVYPLEAYVTSGIRTIELKVPVEAYYEGYNNTSEEFTNPYQSNTAKATIVVNYSEPVETFSTVKTYIGQHVYNPEERQVVSKKEPLRLYNGMDKDADDIYVVTWFISTGVESDNGGIILKERADNTEQVSDTLIKNDMSEENDENITSNIGICFENVSCILGNSGWIKVFNDDTDELLGEFNETNWNNYSLTNPYKYKFPAKHIRVETSEPNASSSLYVYNIKEINSEYLVNKYTKEEFDNLKYIRTTLNGYFGEYIVNTVTDTAAYEVPYSIAELHLSKTNFPTQQTEKNIEIEIDADNIDKINQTKWINGEFLLRLPENVIDLEINSVGIDNTNVLLTGYEKYEENGVQFIKISTQNEVEEEYKIYINCNITADPNTITTSGEVELFAKNENAFGYYYEVEDVYDIDNDGNTTEKINKVSETVRFDIPETLLTSENVSDFGVTGETAIAPKIAEIDNTQRIAKINIGLRSNYSGNISNVKVLGRIPFENNKSVISNENLNSEFSVTMSETGISIPNGLQGKVTVYYSENEDATNDLIKASNAWEENPADFDQVKSYLIDFGEYTFEKDESYELSYEINIPDELDYNKITHSNHAVYFNLVTSEGKIYRQTETNKIGIRIVKKYNIELTKLQLRTNKAVCGAEYRVYEEGKDLEKTGITDDNGKIEITSLLLNKTYVVEEKKSPESYILNTDKIKFTVTEENNKLKVSLLEGDPKSITAVQGENKISITVEDEVKARLKIYRYEKGTNSPVEGVKIKVTGNGLPSEGKFITTNENGEGYIDGINASENYTIEEVYADGYYLSAPIVIRVNKNNGNYSSSLVSGNCKSLKTVFENNQPVVKVTLETEKIPTYNLEITKVKKTLNVTSTSQANTSENTEEVEVLQGAVFEILKDGKSLGQYTTDATGKVLVENFYRYVEENGIDQEYVLREIKAPNGYVIAKDTIFSVSLVNGELQFNEKLEKGQIKKEYTVEDNTIKVIIPDNPMFKIIKKDADTNQTIAGAKFAIYENKDGVWENAQSSKGGNLGTREIINDKEYYTVTTNANGEVYLDLPEGEYKAVEVWAEEKYDINNSIYYFSIGKDSDPETELQVTFGQAIGGTSSNDNMKSVVETSDGGYIAVGYYEGTMTVNNETYTSRGSTDGIVIKYNADNTIAWVSSLGGTGSDNALSVAETSDGGFAVVGTFTNTLYVGNTSVSYYSGQDGFLIKYTSAGAVSWVRRIGYSNTDTIPSVTSTIDNGIALVMQGTSELYMNGTTLSGGVMVLKYDLNGNMKVFKKVTDNISCSTSMYSISQNSNGEYIISGDISGPTIKINEEEISNIGSAPCGLVLKLDSEFNVIWSRIVGGDTSADFCYASTATKDGGAVVGLSFLSDIITINGETYYNNTYDPNSSNSSRYYDALIVKYDTNGDVAWVKHLDYVEGSNNYEYIYSIKESSDGRILIGGYMQSGHLKVDNLDIITGFGSSCPNGFILILDENGEPLDADTLRGASTNYIYGVAFVEDEIVAVGQHYSYLRTEVGRISTFEIKYNQSYTTTNDGFVLKIKEKELKNNFTVDKLDIYGKKTDSYSPSSTAYKVKATKDGGTVVVGTFSGKNVKIGNKTISSNMNGTSYYTDVFVIKYDNKNDIDWVKTFGNNTSQNVSCICETSDNGVVIVGTFSGSSISIDNVIINNRNGTSSSNFIIKLNENGEVEWANHFYGSSGATSYAIEETNEGDLFITGYTSSSQINAGELVLNKETSSSMPFILKVNKNGNYIWIKKIGDCYSCSNNTIKKLDNGNYIIAAYMTDNSERVTISNESVEQGLIFIEIDKDGNKIWCKNIIENNGGGAYPFSVIQTKDGGIAVCGYWAGNGVIIKGESIEDSSFTYPKAFVVKCDKTGNIEWYDWFSGGYNCEELMVLRETSDGSLLAGGWMQSEEVTIGDETIYKDTLWTGAQDAILVKYSKDGNVIWAKNFVESSYDYMNDFDLDDQDNIYAVGSLSYPYRIGNIKEFVDTNTQGYYVKIRESAFSPETQELLIKNDVKKFKISTNINKIDEIEGGSISGYGNDYYEKVKYNESSTKEIKIIPDDGYEIIGITINGKEYQYEAAADGTYTMPAFNSVTEDKRIEVTFSLKTNKITINKLDDYSDEKLQGATFRLNQIDEREEPDSSEIVGEVVNSNTIYNAISKYLSQDEPLYSNGSYYFINKNGYLVPTNSKTYRGTSGVANTTANSYIPIDLTGVTGTYYVYISQKISSQSGCDYGYATITQSTTAPNYNDSNGRFLYTSGETTSYYGYRSQYLYGGNKYYLHLGYRKDGNTDTGEDQMQISNIYLYKSGIPEKFVYNNGKWESANQGTTLATNCYIPIDLRNYEGYYKITVNAEISSKIGDYGYATINESTNKAYYYTDTNNRFIYITGEQSAKDYSTEIAGGKMYYLHLGYYKNSPASAGEDKFSFDENINISLSDKSLGHTTFETNSAGQAITQIPFGKYYLTEISAPEGYELDSESQIIEFRAGNSSQHEFTVKDKKLGKVIVHHYIKGTEEPIFEDEILVGKRGESYTSSPRMDIENYELEKDSEGKYILPDNYNGTYAYEDTEITYYYVKNQIPLVVHHYLEGTLIPVPLADGTQAEDEYSNGGEGEEYTTSALSQEELDDMYELVEAPRNSESVYTEPEVEVTYYYRIKRFNVVTSVKPHEETNELGETITVSGGTITGEDEDIYETIEYKNDSSKVITITPDEGYQIKSITINGETVDFEPAEDGSVTLDNFTEMTESKNIEVEFQKNQGRVVVHHYLEDTELKVPSINGNVVEDETKQGFIGVMYVTGESEDVYPIYEFVRVEGETSGEFAEEEKTVTYYYRLKYPIVENTIEIDTLTYSTLDVEENEEIVTYPLITKEDEQITYKLKYTVSIDNYKGRANIQIEDTLPHSINTAKSDLDGGTYDTEDRKIVWNEPVEIDTFENGKYEAEIEKEITISYNTPNTNEDIENIAKGIMILYYPENHPEVDDVEGPNKELLLDIVEDKSIVKQEYKVKLQVKKLWNSIENEHKPESVTVEIKANNSIYKEVELNSENDWQYEEMDLPKYDDSGIEILYTVEEKDIKTNNDVEIKKIILQDENETTNLFEIINGLSIDTELSVDATDKIAKSTETVDYEIYLNSSITNHRTTGKVRIVDTLPYKIDVENSSLDGGIYDEETNTITWEEETLFLYDGVELENDTAEQTDDENVQNTTENTVTNEIANEITNTISNETINTVNEIVVENNEISIETTNTTEGTLDDNNSINSVNNVTNSNLVPVGAPIEDDKIYRLEISKNITIAYIDIVFSDEVIVNKVNAEVDVEELDLLDTAEASAETSIEIPGKVVVKYLDATTGAELSKPITKEGLVGTSYTTEEQQITDYILTGTPKNSEGKIAEGTTEVIYYYKTAKATAQTQTTGTTTTQLSQSQSSGNTTLGTEEKRNVVQRIVNPKTGDMVPVVAYSTIAIVLLANIMLAKHNSVKLDKVTKVSRMSRTLENDRTQENGKKRKKKAWVKARREK